MEIIGNACIISLLGIGFVFLFLAIQVVVTNAMSKLGAKYSYLLPEPQKAVKRPAAKPAAAAPQQNDGELVAVISAAIKAHTAK